MDAQVERLIGDRLAALPEELLPVIDDIAAGRVRSLVVLVELDDEEVGDLFALDMNGTRSNRFALLGAIEALKRDFMRAHIRSRVDYVESVGCEGDDEEE